mgnify:CR=1 FL=1
MGLPRMKKRKYRPSVFVVTYREEKGEIKYLLLHRILHWEGWEFPKGGTYEDEEEEETIKRELKEEAGLDVIEITKFGKEGKFKYSEELSDRKGIKGQTWKLYVARVGEGDVNISNNPDKEHDDYEWLGFREAYKKLTHDDQKECLEEVNHWIKGD